MRKLLRAIRHSLLFFLLLLLIAAGGIGFIFWRTQPVYEGQVALPQLGDSVEVFRDEHAVPHIFAKSMEDAARALGYIHADERLFQMEIQRRAGAGRLAEILGADMLNVDKFTRTLGLYRLAEDSYAQFSPEAKKLIDAYVDGVNAWLTTHEGKLPPEFLLLQAHPEPWKPADSLVWGKLMSLQLSENYHLELMRAHLVGKLAEDKLKLLFPLPAAGTPITTQPRSIKEGKSTIEDATTKLAKLTGLDHAASNEWVIGGARTESGKPILANDPHLGLEAPILWYLVRIVTPDLELRGATVPGLPVVVLGQNNHLAWGFTTTGSDVQDLYVETIDPNDDKLYRTPDISKPFETREEVFHVKDAGDVTITVRSTRHGPVLSDIDEEMRELAGKDKVMALSFTSLATGDRTAEALARINLAKNKSEFMDALKHYQGPPQNIVYADSEGHFGFVAAGLVPVRKSGKGLVPADGASGEGDWQRLIPLEEAPQLHDPAAGYVFNANNAIVPPDYPLFYGEDWQEPFRAERLEQLINMTSRHNVETSIAMQGDHISLAARLLLPYLLRAEPIGKGPLPERVLDAHKLMRAWNGDMEKDTAEPLIFDAWLYEMHQLLLVEKTGDFLEAEGPYDARAIANILANGGDWCEKGCNAVISQALNQAIALLTERNGPDITAWRWGHEHQATLRHKLYSHVPVLDFLSELKLPSSGDFYTLDRGGNMNNPPDHPFERTHGAGFRGIYDLADPSRSRFMIASGQSGHLFSRHYNDLFPAWNRVESITLTGAAEELKGQGLKTLTFTRAQ